MGAGGTIVIGRTRLMSRLMCVLLVAFVVHAAATVAVSGDSTFPSASAWRVVNAQSVGDHWKIGELLMLDVEGQSTAPLIRSVFCSYNYDDTDLNVVHDDVWSTDGGRGMWAGSTDESGACSSWLGFEFARPVSIHSVNMAQGPQMGPMHNAPAMDANRASQMGSQRVLSVSLEARINEEWQHVANVHFSTCVSNFVGRIDASAAAQTQCEAVETSAFEVGSGEDGGETECEHAYNDQAGEYYEEDGAAWPAVVFPVVIVGLLVGGCVVARRTCFKPTAPPAAIPQAVAAAIPMQQPMALAVATTMPVQQPAHVQQPAASIVMVTRPPGLKPGDTLQVAGPGGQMMQVPVPAGVQAGGQFMVQMPAAPVVAASSVVVTTGDGVVMGTVVSP